MTFKDSLRLEQIYFQKLKDMIKTCKVWYDGENTDKDRDILEALIQACAAILLLYRNLGEEWNELTALIQKTMHDLIDLKDKTDAYHDELNEKIDDVNNYLNAAITALEIRVENIENSIEAFGGLPSNANAEEGDVLTVGENHVNEWKTLNTAPIYIEANFDEDEHEVILTLDNEPITNSEIFALLDAGKDVKIILNSFDNGVHNELPVILNYVKTFNETIRKEEHEIELTVETRFFQACIMPAFSVDNSTHNLTYFNAYNLGISTMTHDNLIVKNNIVNVVPYTFNGIEINLFSPVTRPTQSHRVDLDILNAPQMHDFMENYVLNNSPWRNSINATLTYYDNSNLPYSHLKANLYEITDPDFDAQTNTYKIQMIFNEIQITTTSPNYNIRRWRVIWEYNPENKTDSFYIPAGMS